MTAPITDETPRCILQEMAYTCGWRDYARGEIVGGQVPEFRKPYAIGWRDHQDRDRCAAMYAAERKTNGRA